MKIHLWNKKDAIFDGYLDCVYQTMEHCDVYYVENMGFAVLNHQPRYAVYKRMGVPEIQDVFVMPNFRGQGVATALIIHCEQQVAGETVGISVPVSPNYGVAQRLYYKMGYMPDGNGVTYDREMVKHGDKVNLDENCCLMMVKSL